MLKNGYRIILCLLFIGGFFICPFFVFGAANDVVINEIMYNLPGVDDKHEWVEILNTSNAEIDLTEWKFNDGSNHALNEPPKNGGQGSLKISAGEYLILTGDATTFLIDHPGFSGTVIDTVMSLKNTTATLKIIDSENNEIDSVIYENIYGADGNGKTLERINSQNDWQESTPDGGTPGILNSIGEEILSTDEETIKTTTSTETTYSVPNRAPIAEAGTDIIALVNQELSFDASHSLDLDNDKLTFFWNFGDGATETEEIAKHTYLYPGQYIVSLLVSDDEFSDLDIITINIYSESIIISEFSNKWIEIFNQSDQVANLTNWQLNNIKASSSPFTFPANSLIASKQFLVLRQEITKIELDDTSDQIQLIYPDGSIGTEVSYLNEDNKNFCIAFDNNDYFWTNIPTPGSANIISIGIKTQEENFPKNNPEPIINEIKEIPEILAINLTKNQNFDTQNISTTSINNLQTESFQETQPASLIQKVQSNQKSKLILYISIIISVSLMLSWVIILVRSKVKFH